MLLESFDYGRLGSDWPGITAYATENKESPRSITNKFGMEFVEIPPGRFFMGRPLIGPMKISSVEHLNTQLHRVEITQPFFLGVTEVTGWEVSEIGIADGKWNSESHVLRRPGHERPHCIASWNEANDLAATLSKLDPDYNYRLPTEAEWEYACRGQVDADYPTKEDEEVVQPYGSKYGTIAPVKLEPPNTFGLYDMLRNAGEYCSDWHSIDYYNRSPLKDPQGPAVGKSRIARGFRGEGNVWQRHTIPPRGDDNILIGVRFVLEKK